MKNGRAFCAALGLACALVMALCACASGETYEDGVGAQLAMLDVEISEESNGVAAAVGEGALAGEWNTYAELDLWGDGCADEVDISYFDARYTPINAVAGYFENGCAYGSLGEWFGSYSSNVYNWLINTGMRMDEYDGNGTLLPYLISQGIRKEDTYITDSELHNWLLGFDGDTPMYAQTELYKLHVAVNSTNEEYDIMVRLSGEYDSGEYGQCLLIAKSASAGTSTKQSAATEERYLESDEVRASATGVLTDKYGTYYDSYAYDGNTKTTWASPNGYGIGDSITFRFDTCRVKAVAVNAGYQKSSDIYYKNSRPKEITVYGDSGVIARVCLDDVMARQVIEFNSAVQTGSITIEIDSVYKGNKYKDLCICEVAILAADAPKRGTTTASGGSIADRLMDDVDFYDYYPGFRDFGTAVGSHVNEDHTWTWRTFFETAGYAARVINCNEWVSLRREPSTDSTRLEKVPLNMEVGALGTWNEWTLCVYNDRCGWILSEYLKIM